MKRDLENKMVAGVCAGIANSFGIDKTIVRLLFVLATLGGFGVPLLVYIVLAILMPIKSE